MQCDQQAAEKKRMLLYIYEFSNLLPLFISLPDFFIRIFFPSDAFILELSLAIRVTIVSVEGPQVADLPESKAGF